MYFFFNAPKSLSTLFIPNIINGIVSFRNFALCAVYNSNQILIFENKSYSLVGYFRRSAESIEVYGNSVYLECNSDASLIAITTDKAFLLIFSLKTISGESWNSYGREVAVSKDNFFNFPVSLSTEINLLDVINFSCNISCLCLYREDLLIALEDGTLTRIQWDGKLLYNQEVKLTSISFFNDLEFSKASNLSYNETLCHKLEWFPSLSGVIVLFTSGKSALLHIPNHKLHNKHITGVWAEYLRHATCVAVNVKFRSVAYGLKMGEAVIYKTEEETGALRLQHRLKILCNEYPNADKVTGSVTYMKWSPDYFCLALCWDSNGFSLWSVQGSLLFSSLGNRCGVERNLLCLDWGCEGYSLWTVEKPDDKSKKPNIWIFQMAKSILIVNPTKHNHEHLLLLSTSYIIFGSRNFLSNYVTNLDYIYYPEIYIGMNWPIKYAAIDSTSSRLAISGKYGFALYFLPSKKWRLFGNETQEHSIEISGGLVWYKHIICFSCFDNKENKLEIRLYNSLIKIDNSLSFNFQVNSQILQMNIFDNTLVTLSIDGLVNLYELNVHQESNSASIEFVQVISLQNYIEFAACVVSFNLTSLHTELSNANAYLNESIKYQSLLINYSGHLLMFQREKSFSSIRSNTMKSRDHSFFKLSLKDHDIVRKNTISFIGPMVVAYNVEIMWTPLIHEDTKSDWNAKIYTMENALWLNCGAHGLRVWLPLNGNQMNNGGEKKTKHTFLSKRIMLTCKIANFYPLVVLNNEALLMSPMNEFSHVAVDAPYCEYLPFANITINRHIFLQHIIKELLRINLGIHALDLTLELKKLPYFNHSLELLLHEVLEEEATSKEPIPDPLLPRVVAFIQEFPNFLKTLVQCARKTELALWSYLFESAGNPEDLFESCLMNNELDTAASYLVILQNTEHPVKSQQHAIQLLDSALQQSNWFLARNLIRFLKNIADESIKNEYAFNEFKIIEKSNSHSAKEPTPSLSYISRRRYKSGGGINIITPKLYDNTKNQRDLITWKNIKHTLNQSTNINKNFLTDENSSSEFGVDLLSSKLMSLVSPTLSNFENEFNEDIDSNHSFFHSIINVPTDNKNDLNYHSTYENSFKEYHDHLTNDSIKINYFDKEVDMVLTKFAHKQFQEYRLHTLVEFFVNIQSTENYFISWMIRERFLCSKILNPVQAFLCIHEDFHWPLQNHLDISQKSHDQFINISEWNNSHNIFLARNIRNKSIMELNRKKLMYLANILIKAEYWEWSFLFLLMIEECEEILSLLRYFLSVKIVDKTQMFTEMIDFVNKITSWNLNEGTRYVSMLLKIQGFFISFEDMLKDHKSGLTVNTENGANKNTKLNEDFLISSPAANHTSLTLGQLIIDAVSIKPENVLSDSSTKIENIKHEASLNEIDNLPKETINEYLLKSPNSEKLKSAFNLSSSSESLTIDVFDILVSSELDDQKHSMGCSVS